MRIGREIGGSAAVLLGVFIVLGDDFATPWESVPAAGHLRAFLAYLTGAVMIASGAGMFWARTARAAAVVLAAISVGFTLLWVQVAAKAPRVYDSWGCIAEQSSIAAGYLAIFASLAPQKTLHFARLAFGARVWFGVCSISFCVVHFLNLEGCASMVPSWIPLSGMFWSVATGVAHLAVAVAILSGIWALLAARLASLMYLGFGLLAWGPFLLGHPEAAHFGWGGEVITFALVAAVWMIGDCVVAFPSLDGQLFLPRASVGMVGRPHGTSEAMG